jgi:hypothetical protein
VPLLFGLLCRMSTGIRSRPGRPQVFFSATATSRVPMAHIFLDPQRVLRSIPLDQLELLVDNLEIEMKEAGIPAPDNQFNSEHLKKFLEGNRIWLLEHDTHKLRFSQKIPKIVLTYMWQATNLKEIVGILKEFAGDNGLPKDVTCWVDIFMNKQFDGAIDQALANARDVYTGSDFHLAIIGFAPYPAYSGGKVLEVKGKQVFTDHFTWDRCWCSAELYLRDVIGCDINDKSETFFVVQPKYRHRVIKELESLLENPRNYHFCLEGKDAAAIQENLLLLGTEDEFNIKFHSKVSKIYKSLEQCSKVRSPTALYSS